MSRVAVAHVFVATMGWAAAGGIAQTVQDAGTVKGKIVLFGKTNPTDSTTSLVKTMARDASTETLSPIEFAVSSGRVSPDGRHFAYVAEHEGQAAIRLLSFGDRRKSSLRPTDNTAWIGGWSPDGTSIAFGCGRRGNRVNSILNVNSKEVQPIALPASELVWDWSPDGKELLTISEPQTGQPRQIQRAKLDGSGLVCLTDRTTDNILPRFSPDGRKVVFSSTRTRRAQVYVMDPDGKNVVQLTSFKDRSSGPACWSPDGKEICCRSYKTGPVDAEGNYTVSDGHLVLMNADGTDPKDFLPPDGSLGWFFDWR